MGTSSWSLLVPFLTVEFAEHLDVCCCPCDNLGESERVGEKSGSHKGNGED